MIPVKKINIALLVLIVIAAHVAYTPFHDTEGASSSRKSSFKEEYKGKSSPQLFGKVPEDGLTPAKFCKKVNDRFVRFGWFSVVCNPDRWNIFAYTEKGNPLLYKEFGFQNTDAKGPVNLVLCGVHGDESVGVYQCFQIVRDVLFDSPDIFRDTRLVIAPIVNPDGFFANTRHNAKGVDPNRNLPTKDWDKLAHSVWQRFDRDPRKFPGTKSGSEVESQFQVFLIEKYRPDKIISFHAPLNFLDFDGPGDRKHYNLLREEHRARYLGMNIEANTNKFIRLVDFPFFPGSLGNYAGNERKIPTYTIEFRENDPLKADEYWNAVRYALIQAMKFTVYDEQENPAINDRSAGISEREPAGSSGT